jgi:hypothetical protein
MDYIIIAAVIVLIIALLFIYYNSTKTYAGVPASPTQPTTTIPIVPTQQSTQPTQPIPTPTTSTDVSVVPTTPVVQSPAPPSPITVSVPEMVGCYLDSSDRALPKTLSSIATFDACAKAAKNAGSTYFGLQYPEGSKGTGKAQCWYGNGQYDKHGSSTKCYLKDSNGRYLGGVWANSVYKL